MYNEVRTQQLTEAELRSVVRNMIIEEIENGQLDEGIRDYIRGGWNAMKNTFGGDAERVGNAGRDAVTATKNGLGTAANAVGDAAGAVGRGISNAAGAVGRGIGKAAGAVGDAAGAVGRGIGNAAGAVGKYASTRAKAFKTDMRSQMNQNKIQSVIDSLAELNNAGFLNSEKAQYAYKEIVNTLMYSINTQKGQSTRTRNQLYGKK